MAGDQKCLDCGDWIVVVFLFGFQIAAGVFVFMHPAGVNFAAWVGTLTVACGAFHWLRVRDQKIADA